MKIVGNELPDIKQCDILLHKKENILLVIKNNDKQAIYFYIYVHVCINYNNY